LLLSTETAQLSSEDASQKKRTLPKKTEMMFKIHSSEDSFQMLSAPKNRKLGEELHPSE